jgi:hypothetical protein
MVKLLASNTPPPQVRPEILRPPGLLQPPPLPPQPIQPMYDNCFIVPSPSTVPGAPEITFERICPTPLPVQPPATTPPSNAPGTLPADPFLNLPK